MESFFMTLLASCTSSRSQKWTVVFTVLMVLFSSCYALVSASGDDYMSRADHMESTPAVLYAAINITYEDPVTGSFKSDIDEIGLYSERSGYTTESGIVVHVRTEDNKTDGCTPLATVPQTKWVALVRRGSCKFATKIYNAAVLANASAVVIYNNQSEELIKMKHKIGPSADDIVSVFISKANGEHIAALVDNGTRVMMTIRAGRHGDFPGYHNQINKTSVIVISFIVLMIISLAWLVFYCIQRFRYAHAKERLLWTSQSFHASSGRDDIKFCPPDDI